MSLKKNFQVIIANVLIICLGIFLFSCSDLSVNNVPAEETVAEDDMIIMYSSPVAPEVAPEDETLVPDSGDEVFSRADIGNGPLVGQNSIYFKIGTSTYAGSSMAYIDIKFGTKNYRLYSYSGDYKKGSTHSMNLNNSSCTAWFESWDQDLWDRISFNTTSTDGIIFSKVKIVHSDQVILDYKPPKPLDYPTYKKLSFYSAIRAEKYSKLNSTHSIVRKGLRDLGKTDKDKYGSTGAWCSEFAAYCTRALWHDLPIGEFGTKTLKTYYKDRNRYRTLTQVYKKSYTLGSGDYMSINNGNHSVIFSEWVGNPTTFNSGTQFRTIEGNCGSAVRVKTRTLSCVQFIGVN